MTVIEEPGTVAVTGAGGFLGGHVCRALAERGHLTIGMSRSGSSRKLPADLTGRVEAREGDVLDIDSLEAALWGAHTVVHCAGLVSIDSADGERIREVNVTGARNVIEACIRLGVRRLIHVSSVHAYAPLRGTELRLGSLLAVDSPVPYCAAKADAHRTVMRAMSRGRIGGCVVCPSGIVGPEDDRPSPVGRALLDIARGKLPLLIDEGYWWCDARDVADVVAQAASVDADGETYFIPGRYAKFARLAELCSETLGRDVRRPAAPYWLAFAALPAIRAYAAVRRMSPLYSRASLSLARNCPDSVDDRAAKTALGYAARPLDESIRDSLAWFHENGLLP